MNLWDHKGLIVLWALALGSVAVLIDLGRPATERLPPTEIGAASASPVEPASAKLVARRLGHTWGGWRVLDEVSAHRVAVVHIEVERMNEARRISQQIVEPYKAKYHEVLMYFVPPGHRGLLPTLRVQWTPKGGYSEIWYDEPAQPPGTR